MTKRGLGCRVGTTVDRSILSLVRCCSSKTTLSNGWTRSAGSCAFSATDQVVDYGVEALCETRLMHSFHLVFDNRTTEDYCTFEEWLHGEALIYHS